MLTNPNGPVSGRPPHLNKDLTALLQGLDLGYSIAEEDTLLEAARIETSAFTDLLNDRVDLVPGTKGSGKSALFRIFVDNPRVNISWPWGSSLRTKKTGRLYIRFRFFTDM